MRDPFDQLLKEAKRHRFETLRAQQIAKLSKAKVKVELVLPPTYQRPRYQLESEGWYESRTLMILRLNPQTGQLTNLGVYIEYLHPKVPGRHLTPCPSLDTAPASETVTSWGEGRPRPPAYVETAEDIEAIRNRFKTLLDEFNEIEATESINGF